MKKLNLIAFILVIFMIFLTSCKTTDPTNGKNPAPADITSKILNQGGFVELFNISEERLPREYTGVDMSKIQSFSVYVCASNASADELAVFKMKNVSDISKITTTINQRIKDRQDTFENYNVGEKPKLKNYTLKYCGPYVLFVVSNSNQKAEKTFNEFFK